MKFDNLNTIQQVAILADLAGLIDLRPGSYLTEPYILPGESEEYDISKCGLSTSLRFLRLTKTFNCNLAPQSEEPYKLRFNVDTETNEVSMYMWMEEVPEYTDAMGLGKYGLTNNVTIKGPVLSDSLNDILKFLKSFEKLLKTNTRVSDTVQLLINEIPKAQLIDEEFLDRLFVNRPLAMTLSQIGRKMYTLDIINEIPPYLKETDVDPEYSIGARAAGHLVIYHTASKDNPKAYKLAIALGADDDLVEVLCGQNESDTLHRIGSFIPVYDGDEKAFINSIADQITDIVLGSDYRDNVANKLTYFIEQLAIIAGTFERTAPDTTDTYDVAA